METYLCAMCGGDLRFLGTLGEQDHFRCVDCGWEQSYHNALSGEPDEPEEIEFEEPFDGFLTDAEADADVLASAGMGTDEDYNGYCYNDDSFFEPDFPDE